MTPSDRQSLRDAGQDVCLVCGAESKNPNCGCDMTPEQMLARQIGLSFSLAIAKCEGMERAIELAERAIREAIKQAVLKEREECAQICEQWHSSPNAWTAVAIRSRKDTP